MPETLLAVDLGLWTGPKTLRHDAAEAILLGFWAVRELRWLAGEDPPFLRRDRKPGPVIEYGPVPPPPGGTSVFHGRRQGAARPRARQNLSR